MHRIKKNLSLKTRIFLFFFGILLLMICTYIFAISRFITRFTEEQLNADYVSILSETCDTTENLLWNLTLTSQQLLENDDILANLINWQDAADHYSRQKYYENILGSISSLTMANTDIALIYLFDPSQNAFIYSSLPVDDATDSTNVLYQNSAFGFEGPCKSQSRFIGNPVLILNRTEMLSNGNAVTLSVESGYYSLDNPIHAAERKSAYLVFTNYKEDIIFSTFPKDWDEKKILTDLQFGVSRDFRFFTKKNPQGWSVHIVIPNHVYTRDYRLAIRDFMLCSILVAILAGVFAIYFWRSIYHPLQLFDKQLNILLSDDTGTEPLHSSVPEYDYLLHKIVLLQKQIQDMIHKIIVSEKLHTKMQLEKMRAQINPHFLMNTLNTLHWMALMNQQMDIDRITQALSHLLSYNLDKESNSTNLKNELSALREYVTLQQVRYNFNFEITKSDEASELNFPCPKFILQPLVENSLSHGYREQMDILLRITVGERIIISLQDTGTGMDNDTLQKLRQIIPYSGSEIAETLAGSDSSNMNFGIGLPYVIQSLNDFYSGKYDFSINSSLNEGTIITLTIPKLRGGGYYAENIDN